MKLLDKWLERGSRKVAQNTSRRHLLTNLSKVMIGVAAVPLLPVARASEATGGYPGVGAQTSGLDGDPGIQPVVTIGVIALSTAFFVPAVAVQPQVALRVRKCRR